MTTILVSGSRSLNKPYYLGFFEKVVARVWDNGWHLIIGDAKGVDYGIAYAASAYAYQSKQWVTVYGIQQQARFSDSFKVWPKSMEYVHLTDCTTYTARDEYMVLSADYVYCLWDGKSKGTKHVYDYAKSLGKTAWLHQFN